METIKWAVNHMPKTEDANLPVMALSEVEKARTFHESFPQYSVTPLVKLNHMAEKLGLGSLYIKDESYRFGLNAFKVLGDPCHGTLHRTADREDVSELPYNILTSEALKKSSVRPPSLLQPMETMDAELPGLPTSSDKRQLS